MRADFVILSAKLIQPALLVPAGMPPLQSPMQSSVHSLHLALRLRMAVAAEQDAHSLPHQPHRQFRPAPRTDGVADAGVPWSISIASGRPWLSKVRRRQPCTASALLL